MDNDWRNELITKGAAFDALKDNVLRLTLAEEQRCEGHVVWDEDVVFADVLEKALLALPPTQPQDIARDIATIIENEKDMRVILDHQWIPVSEKLPNVRQWVLCQCRANIMDVLRLTDDDCWYRKSNEIYMSGFVLAWMPLPDPWKGE